MKVPAGISVALGGGGAKCYTQVGILRQLERAQIPLAAVAATSAACILAALYGSGYSLDQIAASFSQLENGRLIRPAWGDRSSLFSLSRIGPILETWIGGRNFEDLRFPVGFTSVDLETGQTVFLDSGPLLPALMAALAVPGLFPPQRWNGRQLIDGGVAYSVPVGLARRLAPGRPVLAVALFPPYEQWDRHPLPQLLDSLPVLRWIGRWRVFRALQIYVRANDITHRRLAEFRLDHDQPDFIVRPDVDHIGLFDRIDLDRALQLGEQAVRSQLPALQGVLNGSAAAGRRLRIPASAARNGVPRVP